MDGLIILILIFLWMFPFLNVLFSSSVSGTEKIAWLLAIMFISWFAWIFYLLLAPIKRRDVND
jgi:hypothetical protein